MICSKCGAHNPEDADECRECGWSLKSRLAVEEQACANHPWRRAVSACVSCGLDLCEECEVPLGGVMYCRECAERPAEEDLLRDVLVVDPATAESATFSSRLVAAAIDCLIVLCAFSVLWVAFWLFTGDAAIPFGGSEHPVARVVFWLAIGLGLPGFFVYSIASSAQTPGMSTMDIAVVRETGQAVDFRTAAIRFLALVPTVVSIWGVFCSVSDPYGRMLHDKLTHTRVVRMGG